MHPTIQILMRHQDTLAGYDAVVAVNPPDSSLLRALPAAQVISTDFAVYQSLPAESGIFGLESSARQFNAVLLFMPKSKKELSMLIQYAVSLLEAEGVLYLVGEKKSGVASGAKVLAAMGDCLKIDSAKHCQLWECQVASAHRRPFVLKDWFEAYTLAFESKALQIATIPGVFSQDGLDLGTQLLVDTLSVKQWKDTAGRVLDFACGSGVLGAFLKTKYPDMRIEMVDVSWLALMCAKRTAELNGLELTIYPSNGWSEVKGRVNGVVTNPPFHTGLNTDYSVAERFIQEAPGKMTKFAPIYLVANHFLKYAEPVERAFGYCEVSEQNSKFKVYYTSR